MHRCIAAEAMYGRCGGAEYPGIKKAPTGFGSSLVHEIVDRAVLSLKDAITKSRCNKQRLLKEAVNPRRSAKYHDGSHAVMLSGRRCS
jgi:hypothetical protein